MKIRKKFFAVCIAVLSLGLNACNKTTSDDMYVGDLNSEITYVDTDISEIPDINGVLAYERIGRNNWVLGTNSLSELQSLSSVDGYTWSADDMSWTDEVPELAGGYYIYAADLSNSGAYVLAFDNAVEDAEEVYRKHILYAEPTKSVYTDISVYEDKSIFDVRFSEDGSDILVNVGDAIIQYGNDGTEKNTFSIPDIIDAIEMSDAVIILAKSGLYVYDAMTAECKMTEDCITDNFEDDIDICYSNKYSYISNSFKVMHEADSESENISIYLMLSSGFYKYTLGSDLVECVASGTGTCLDSEDCVVPDYYANDEDIYCITLSDTCMFTAFVPGNQVVPVSTTLTVYSLYDTEQVEYLADAFEKEYPEVDVVLEIGIPEDSEISENNAINALNTELLSGNGPDVLFLDGLNINSYAENGYLMDLTDVYNQIMTEYPNCLESVLSSYKTDEGMYAIPAFEKFTVLVAPESKLDEINGMDGLISYIATCENFPYSNDLAIYDWDYLFNLTYPSCADDIYDFQGNYNEESMEEYVYQLKELWQLLMSHTSEENIADWELTVYNQQEHNVPIHRANYNLYAMYFQEYSGRSVAIAQPEWINDACSIGNIRYANDAKYSFDAYTIFSNDGDCSYIPYMSAGINSQTLNKEYGIEFVVSMFSDDFQQKQFVATGKYADIIGKSGLPSNMDAWHMRNRDENYNAYGGLAKQEVLDFYDDPGYEADAWTYFAFDVDAQEAEFEELFTSLDTPVNMDKIFISMVCEHLEEYLNDEITLDEYMEELNASVMLYINE